MLLTRSETKTETLKPYAIMEIVWNSEELKIHGW